MTALVQPESAHVRAGDRAAKPSSVARDLAKYFMVGIAFGLVLVKAEVISWYRIQEMFRFQSIHMYGVLGSAMLTAMVSLEILKRTQVRALNGESISVPPKKLGKGYRYWIGGFVFGVGWALTGACPGPLFALIGAGTSVFLAVAIAALVGTWTYGLLRPHLLH